MLPIVNNLTVYQGDTFTMLLRLYEKNLDGTKGAAVDLTGATPKAQVRTKHGDAVMEEFSCTLTSTVGEVMLELAPEQTKNMVNGAWDFQITFPDGRVRTYIRGSVTVTLEITSA